MAVVLKTTTSRSFGKASLPFRRGGAVWQIRAKARLNLRDQLSVIFGVVIIKWYSTAAFIGESRYNAPLCA